MSWSSDAAATSAVSAVSVYTASRGSALDAALQAVCSDCRLHRRRTPPAVQGHLPAPPPLYCSIITLSMVALCNRADHYIFILSLVLLLFFFSRLISATADWMSTILPHKVWL